MIGRYEQSPGTDAEVPDPQPDITPKLPMHRRLFLRILAGAVLVAATSELIWRTDDWIPLEPIDELDKPSVHHDKDKQETDNDFRPERVKYIAPGVDRKGSELIINGGHWPERDFHSSGTFIELGGKISKQSVPLEGIDTILIYDFQQHIEQRYHLINSQWKITTDARRNFLSTQHPK